MLFGYLFGLVISVMALGIGLRAIVRRRIVLRPRNSRKPDSEYTYTGKEAVLIGVGWILAASLFGTMSVQELGRDARVTDLLPKRHRRDPLASPMAAPSATPQISAYSPDLLAQLDGQSVVLSGTVTDTQNPTLHGVNVPAEYRRCIVTLRGRLRSHIVADPAQSKTTPAERAPGRYYALEDLSLAWYATEDHCALGKGPPN
jgi:hypothetical protein